MADPADEARLARLREEAEAEMRRRLPGEGGRPAKRRKNAGAAEDGQAQYQQTGGRFDYGAVGELATGVSGFLLTCPIQRENSARKEAGPLLAHYLQQCGAPGAAVPAAAAGEDVAAAAGASAAATAAGGQAEQQHAPLAAIKLPVRGLVALKLPSPPPAAPDSSSGSEADDQDASAALVQRVAAALLADIAAGKQARLAHVQRLIPVATTCCVEAAALQAAGARLAALVAAEAAKEQGGDAAQAPSDAAEGPSAESAAEGQQQQRLTFGIGLRLREDSGGAKPAAAPAAAAEGGEEAAAPAAAPAAVPMDRGAVIKALAAGFEGALREKHGVQAAVDLKSPDWVLLAEALPAGGQLYAALCVLPRRLCLVKPKLHIQPVGKAAGA